MAETRLSKGKGGKHNFPNARPLDVEPGDNSRYLTHAMMVQNMPPINTADPEQVRQRINDYFVLCADHEMKPTVTGFRMALKIAKSTLWTWKQGEFREGSHQAIILEAYDMLEALWEDYMMNGKINPVSGIFLGKNHFGYKDQQEHILTPNSDYQPVDAKVIEEKYAELPELE